MIEYLISNLSKEGFRIRTTKHIHDAGFSIDTKGKDTWKHAKTGTKIVMGALERNF